MYTLELSDQELRVLREALEAHFEEFGHDEADTVRVIKAVMARVAQVSAR